MKGAERLAEAGETVPLGSGLAPQVLHEVGEVTGAAAQLRVVEPVKVGRLGPVQEGPEHAGQHRLPVAPPRVDPQGLGPAAHAGRSAWTVETMSRASARLARTKVRLPMA